MLSPPDAELARRNAAIPGLALVLDPDAFATALRTALPEAGVGTARATYVRYKPGTNCLVAYRLQVAGSETDVYAKAYRAGTRGKLRKARERLEARGALGLGGTVLDDAVTAVFAFPLVHRPERRAVVRLETGGGPCYAKAVLPERVRALAEASSVIHHLAGEAFVTPAVLDVDTEAGVITYSALPGLSLYQLLDGERLVPAARAAGSALRALHRATPPANTGVHDAADEIGVLRHWLDHLGAFMPDVHASLRPVAARVFKALLAGESPRVLLHRDFYDKQILFDADGPVGLLDFDTLAEGEAALDVANALVHLELRALQGRCSWKGAATAAAALVQGYQPAPRVGRRIAAYADATRLRLCCVYAFRPSATAVISALLARVGALPCLSEEQGVQERLIQPGAQGSDR